MFFQNKNNVIEYKDLEKYKNDIELLLSEDKYISRKEYIQLYNANKELYDKLILMDKESVLKSWCKNNKTSYLKLKELIDYYINTESNVNSHNNDFVEKHLQSEKQYLDNILNKDNPNIKLDEEQRKVVLSDEDYTLVIAGAGAGKTTTIEAKVKYLIDKKNIDPNRILIISFTTFSASSNFSS